VRARVARTGSAAGAFRHADIAVALGGDGTMLRAARFLAPHSVPLLASTWATVGFPIGGPTRSNFRRHCDMIVRGGFAVERRWMLSAESCGPAGASSGPASRSTIA